MLGRRISLATVLVLVAGLLAVAPPAHATLYQWEFDERPDGLPATAQPAQSLTSASASVDEKSRSITFHANVTLGAEPSEATDALLRVAIGDLLDGACHETWATEVPTLGPTGIATRVGNQVRLHAEISAPAVDGHGPRCGSVTVLASDGTRTVLDQLVEPGEGLEITDTEGGEARVLKARDLRVEPGRWSTVWVYVRYRGDDAADLSTSGRGNGRVEVKEGRFPTALAHGTRTWVPVAVRLHGRKAQQVYLYANPGVNGWSTGVPLQVWIRPTR